MMCGMHARMWCGCMPCVHATLCAYTHVAGCVSYEVQDVDVLEAEGARAPLEGSVLTRAMESGGSYRAELEGAQVRRGRVNVCVCLSMHVCI